MRSATHNLIAFTSLLTLAAYYPPADLNLATALVAIVANIVGSLLPDLDQAANTLWDLLPAGNTVGKILRQLLLSHRTISHSLLGTYLIYLVLLRLVPQLLNPLYIHSSDVVTAAMVGFIAHVAADAFTKEGVPLFFPLLITIGLPPIKGLRIKSNGWVEKSLILPGVVIYLIWLIASKKEVLLSLIRFS